MTSSNQFLSDFDFLNALFKHARQNAALLMQPNGTVSAISQAFTNQFGYEEKDLQDMKLTVSVIS